MFQSPIQNDQPVEMVVPSTGAEGHHFVSRLPFSWEIKEVFEMTLDTYIGDEEGK